MATPKLPTFPSFDFSALDLGAIDLGAIDLGKIPTVAKDVGYVTVGLAVLAFQKAQVRRHEVTKSLNEVTKSLNEVAGAARQQVRNLLPSA